ncbi:galactose mutarotase-like protein [Auriscalpium vulgare]|uniref:Galactose mutarotase-like protein n=1 Tax=Auriscalpium vulgare TaxID=40419 RepID=A0ACB8RXQ9_9AGAM|nr:galactose mutarotase-like protein [Auriscalpium vulgare]
MLLSLKTGLLKVAVIVSAAGCAFADSEPYPFDVTSISAVDGSITAKFVSIGATLTELWVKDKHGEPLDIVPGYDDNTKIYTDYGHPVFNSVVGRYANRIKNGTFTIPISNDPPADSPGTFHIPTNDNKGADTIHGGIYGWDRRNWTLVSSSPMSVTYQHIDNADEGFPGTVVAFVTHSVESGQLKTEIHASASESTPIMLTQHVYWNLDAFRTQTGSWNDSNILAHTLRIASSRTLRTDSFNVPTGDIVAAEAGDVMDFRVPRRIDARWDAVNGVCGPGCQGYDDCWIYDEPITGSPRLSLWSDVSGIRLDVISDSPATQVYTSNGLSVPRKAVHGGPGLLYGPHAAVAIEQEGWVDAIHNPQWGQDQIYGPGRDFVWSTTYKFSLVQ